MASKKYIVKVSKSWEGAVSDVEGNLFWEAGRRGFEEKFLQGGLYV